MNDHKLSKALSYYLRHAPHELNLQLQPGGWVEQAELLQALQIKNIQATPADLQRVTETSDKQRFAIQGSRIRANQGHSTEVDLELQPQVPPAFLYHGTPSRSVAPILEQGLLKGERHHVHLSPTPKRPLRWASAAANRSSSRSMPKRCTSKVIFSIARPTVSGLPNRCPRNL